MFRRLGALEKLFLVDRSSPQPPPFRMRWHSFSASRPRGVDRAQNSLLLNLASALTELRAGLRPGIFLVGSPSARVCRSAGRYFPAINLESAVINELRANSRAISTSGIKGFKSTEMNTCRKMGGGNGCLSVFSLEHAPHLNAVITRSPRRRVPCTRRLYA
jgi:hypothetical protein